MSRQKSKTKNFKNCSFKNCVNSSKDNSIKLYSFPKVEESCRIWVEACQRSNLKKLSTAYLSRSYRVCEKHFEITDFQRIIGPYKNFLKQGAIPKDLKITSDINQESNLITDSSIFLNNLIIKTSISSPIIQNVDSRKENGQKNQLLNSQKLKEKCTFSTSEENNLIADKGYNITVTKKSKFSLKSLSKCDSKIISQQSLNDWKKIKTPVLDTNLTNKTLEIKSQKKKKASCDKKITKTIGYENIDDPLNFEDITPQEQDTKPFEISTEIVSSNSLTENSTLNVCDTETKVIEGPNYTIKYSTDTPLNTLSSSANLETPVKRTRFKDNKKKLKSCESSPPRRSSISPEPVSFLSRLARASPILAEKPPFYEGEIVRNIKIEGNFDSVEAPMASNCLFYYQF